MKLRVNFGRSEGAEPLSVLRLWSLISDVVRRHSDRLRDSGMIDGHIFVAEVESPQVARGFLRDLAPALRAYIDTSWGRFVTVELGSHVLRADRSDDVSARIEEIVQSE